MNAAPILASAPGWSPHAECWLNPEEACYSCCWELHSANCRCDRCDYLGEHMDDQDDERGNRYGL